MKLRYRIGTKVIYWVWRVMFGFKVKGREHIPPNGGIIIAANHLSNYDPPLIGAGVWSRECYFFAKRELFVINRFYTWLIRAFNAYPVDTERPSKEMLKYTMNLLNKGLGIIFFPEGTRSKTGNFLRFNPGVGWFALKCGVPIIPTLIKGANTPLVTQIIRKNRVYVKFGPPIMPNKEGIQGRMDDSSNLKGKSVSRYAATITQEVDRRIKSLLASFDK